MYNFIKYDNLLFTVYYLLFTIYCLHICIKDILYTEKIRKKYYVL
ncbi:MAG: hypothetical protein RL344_553 [Pseudomonadota bacterium]|jgi:hypothetical protein